MGSKFGAVVAGGFEGVRDGALADLRLIERRARFGFESGDDVLPRVCQI